MWAPHCQIVDVVGRYGQDVKWPLTLRLNKELLDTLIEEVLKDQLHHLHVSADLDLLGLDLIGYFLPEFTFEKLLEIPF